MATWDNIMMPTGIDYSGIALGGPAPIDYSGIALGGPASAPAMAPTLAQPLPDTSKISTTPQGNPYSNVLWAQKDPFTGTWSHMGADNKLLFQTFADDSTKAAPGATLAPLLQQQLQASNALAGQNIPLFSSLQQKQPASSPAYTQPSNSGSGGNFMQPGVPTVFPPSPIGAGGAGYAPSNTWVGPPAGTPGQGMTADQFLADNTNNMGWLQGIAQNAGYATDVTPAWQAMVAQQKRNQERKFADLTAAFGASGNRFSTAFGTAATDYWNQAGLDQNALLGQMMLGSQEAARGRELAASQALGQFGYQGASQLSNQNFQAQQQNYQLQQQQQLQAALAMLGAGSSSANLMAQLGAQGAAGLQAGALQGAQGMFNAENNAASQEIQRQLLLQQFGLGAAQNASQLWQSNLGLGGQLGQQQFMNQGVGLNAQFQEWLRTQPQYNPLLQMIYSSATGFAPTYAPSYKPSWWESLLGAAGGIAGGIGSFVRP